MNETQTKKHRARSAKMATAEQKTPRTAAAISRAFCGGHDNDGPQMAATRSGAVIAGDSCRRDSLRCGHFFVFRYVCVCPAKGRNPPDGPWLCVRFRYRGVAVIFGWWFGGSFGNCSCYSGDRSTWIGGGKYFFVLKKFHVKSRWCFVFCKVLLIRFLVKYFCIWLNHVFFP